MFYAIPENFGPLNTNVDFFVDSLPMTDWTTSEATITHGSTGVQYYVYTDNNTNFSSQILSVQLL